MLKLRKSVSRIGADIREFCRAGIIFLVYFAGADFLFGVFCPQLIITGIPCPGCGLTRAFFCLAGGRIREAAELNFSLFPVMAFLLYCGYFRYVKGEKTRKLGAALALLTVCMLAVYGYGMYLYFPDRAPYIYYQENVLARLIPGYGECAMHALDYLKQFFLWSV